MITLADLLTVTGVLAGIWGLLFLMSVLDPTTIRQSPSQRGTRERGGLASDVSDQSGGGATP